MRRNGSTAGTLSWPGIGFDPFFLAFSLGTRRHFFAFFVCVCVCVCVASQPASRRVPADWRSRRNRANRKQLGQGARHWRRRIGSRWRDHQVPYSSTLVGVGRGQRKRNGAAVAVCVTRGRTEDGRREALLLATAAGTD